MVFRGVEQIFFVYLIIIICSNLLDELYHTKTKTKTLLHLYSKAQNKTGKMLIINVFVKLMKDRIKLHFV